MFTNGTLLWRRGDSTIAHGNRDVTTACPRHPGHCESTEGLLTNQRCSLATGCGITIATMRWASCAGALSYYSDLTLSQEFQPMAVQLLQHSFQWKLRSHWLKFLRQCHVHKSTTPKFVTPTALSCIDNSWRSTTLPAADLASSNQTLPFQNEHEWVLEKFR